jgi:sugar phosphate isomerase/epimerase
MKSAVDSRQSAGITRRRFAAGLAGAGVGLALRRAGAEEPKAASSKFGGIQVGVQSYTFRKFDLDRMITAMRAVGIDSLELWEGHLDPRKASDADCLAARQKLDAAGIKVSAYCVNFRPDSTAELLEKSFLWAGKLGTDIMTTSVQKPIVPRLDEQCVKHKVRLGLHNHWYAADFKGDRSQEFEDADDFLEALKGRSSYLSINLDIGHFAASGYDPVAFFKKHHQRIVSLHIKDRDKDPERSYRRFGEGVTPIKEMARAMKEAKFRYAANLEYEIEEQDPTEGVRHALAYFKNALTA